VVFIFAALAPGGPFLLPIVKLPHLKPSLFSPTRLTPAHLTTLGALMLPVLSAPRVMAQEAPATPTTVPGTPEDGTDTGDTAPEAAPPESPGEAQGDEPASVESPAPEPLPDAPVAESLPAVTPGLETSTPAETSGARAVNSGRDLPAPAAQPSQLFATQLSYNGGVITAEGTAENPVRFVTAAGELKALRIQLDTINQVVEANGEVRLDRTTEIQRREIRARALGKRRFTESVQETLVGQNLHYDFKNSTGKLDSANVQLASLSITAGSLLINGRRYSATNVIVRPGALSEAERKIYGTPPLNIRAKSISATINEKDGRRNVTARGGGLYFRNTRILPLPAYIFRAGLSGGPAEESSYSITPGISLNSADNLLLTTRISVPLNKQPERLTSNFDIGLSQRVGFRGGVGLESDTGFGRLNLRLRQRDIVTTQLTNRIELNRTPELDYRSHGLGTFALPGGRRAGFMLTGTYGDYTERTIGDDDGAVRASRLYGRLLFSTRLNNVNGPFLDLFATTARYGGIENRYNSRGFTVGYEGNLLSRVRGRVSYSSTKLRGDTPFLFDEVQIRRELRSTVDVQLAPRYLLPIDLRYDLSQNRFRDKTFGLLRSYKTFAYGVVYQTARRDLRLEVRQGF
jgi:hypothetical protein